MLQARYSAALSFVRSQLPVLTHSLWILRPVDRPGRPACAELPLRAWEKFGHRLRLRICPQSYLVQTNLSCSPLVGAVIVNNWSVKWKQYLFLLWTGQARSRELASFQAVSLANPVSFRCLRSLRRTEGPLSDTSLHADRRCPLLEKAATGVARVLQKR